MDMAFPADLVSFLELLLPSASKLVLLELLNAITALLKRGVLLAESQATRLLPLIIQHCTVREERG